MKKLIFLLTLLFVVASLMAGVTRITAEKNRPGQAKYPTRAIFYNEDFETGAPGWTHYDGAVSPNQWHIYAGDGSPLAPCWWMGEEGGNGGYYDHQYLVLDTEVITISTGNSTLMFNMRHGLEDPGASGDYDGWDSFNIRISVNAGVDWTVIPTTAVLPAYDFANSYAFGSEFGEGLGVPGWGGMRANWIPVTADLSSYLVGGTRDVKIRFAFAADPAYSTSQNPALFGVMLDTIELAGYSNAGVATGMSFASLVPTAGDFWHVATDATAPSPTHTMSSVNGAGTYVPFMLNYLESPEIVLPADATQIAADFQMKGSYSDTGIFPDVDYFGWEIYHSGSWHYMSNPYSLPAPAPNYVYSGAPDTWASMTSSYSLDGDISELAGQTVKFAWYFQSNGNTPVGTPLQIDDFQIFSVSAAPAPVNLVYPINNQQNLPYTGFNLDWAVSSLGAFPQSYIVGVDLSDANLAPDNWQPSFSLEIIPVLVDTTMVLYSYCNTADIPGFGMTAGQEWYWAVVAGVPDQPEAFSEIWRFKTVPATAVINTFPWLEDFEEAGALPLGWTVGDVDNDAVTWVPISSTTYSHSPTYSMRHTYSDLVPDPGQNGWLVTPPIQLPETGTGVLKFWSYDMYPAYTVHNGVWVNTDPNPLDPYWVNVWEQDDFTTQAWTPEMVDISQYNGNIVYFAFKYTGFDANIWYVDDVSVEFYTSDVLAPVFSNHLPVLNTPREDLTWPVAIDVVDDPVFNNPITAVNLSWSVNGGAFTDPIALTNTAGTTYEGTLPAQLLGSDVTYKFEAYDNIPNMASVTYSYSVADPVWIWYDTGGTGYTGFATYNWGPAVYFENPFYGTDTSVQLLGSDGALHNNTAGNGPTVANMNVYGEDFAGNLTPLMPALPVTFTHRTYRTVDLSALNIQITTPWFWITYEDMGTNRYFLYDATYNYTDPLFLFVGGDLYTSTSTGEWCIGAYVQTGAPAVYFAPEPTIALVGGVPTVSWAAVLGALSYNVYGAADPYAAPPWTLLSATQAATTYAYTGTEGMKFFKVTASTDAATHRMNRQLHSQQLSVTPEMIKADLGTLRK